MSVKVVWFRWKLEHNLFKIIKSNFMKINSTVLEVLHWGKERQGKINRHLFASLHCGLAKCYSILLTEIQNSSGRNTDNHNTWDIWCQKKTIRMQAEMPDKLRQITWCQMKIYKGHFNILPIIKRMYFCAVLLPLGYG